MISFSFKNIDDFENSFELQRREIEAGPTFSLFEVFCGSK